jgi:23S rRNA (adenine2503-C2)-methyltransferase
VVSFLKKNLYDISVGELRDFFIDIGEKSFRADQLWNWLYVKGIKKIESINNISKEVLEKVNANYYIPEFKIKNTLNLLMAQRSGYLKWKIKRK